MASTVEYLHKLGPSHLDLIFSAAEWVFETDRPSGLQIFTADLEEVENLPRHAVSMFLEKIGPDVCQQYLEHIIDALGEDGPEFHEKLVELYLAQVKASKEGGCSMSASSKFMSSQRKNVAPFIRSSSTSYNIRTSTERIECLADCQGMNSTKLAQSSSVD